MPLSEDIRTALEIQQKAYRELIDVVRSSLTDRINQLEAHHSELTVSLQFTQKEVDDLKKTSEEKDDEISKLKKEIAEMKNRKYEEEMDVIKKKLNYQEDYSRRNNLRIDGLEEDPGENWEMTHNKVQRLAREKLGMGEVQLERAHRVGPSLRVHEDGPPRPRTIVARFFRYSDRQQALRNSSKLKNSNIYLNEDLCEASVQVRKAQLPELRKARAEGKIAYFSYTKLVVKERRERTGTIGVSTDSCPVTAVPAPAPALAAGVSTPSASTEVTLGEYLAAARGSGVGVDGGLGPERGARTKRTATRKK